VRVSGGTAAKRAGLGREFAEEVKRATKRISEFANAWPPISKNARRFLLSRFPYGLIYLIQDDIIWIVAVTHLRRDPVIWKKRLQDIEDLNNS
jgi:hypothetical protein